MGYNARDLKGCAGGRGLCRRETTISLLLINAGKPCRLAQPKEVRVLLRPISRAIDHVNQWLKGCVNDIEDMHSYLEKNDSSVNISKFVAIDTDDLTQKTPSVPAASRHRHVDWCLMVVRVSESDYEVIEHEKSAELP
jgi:hypothetical protein